MNPGNYALFNEDFPGEIVTLGKVNLELTKSSSGEKLILVGNSDQTRKGRRRFSSLSQTGLLPNKTTPEILLDPTNTKPKITKRNTGERRLSVLDYKINIQAKIDRLNSIHDYFQQYDPNTKQRRRVQSK